VKEGDTLRLVVIAMDPVNKKLSFSLKQAGPDPWKSVEERYPKDTLVTGTVTRTVDFGAFVELEPGLEGLVHISELASHRVKSANDVAKPGQQVKVRVLDIDPKARRISLSIRRADEPVAAAAAPSVAPVTSSKSKKKQQLRGGLDWNW
jgi:ribosomal protein S1